MKKHVVPVLAVLSAALLATAVYFVFVRSPLEYSFNVDGRLNGSSLFYNQ